MVLARARKSEWPAPVNESIGVGRPRTKHYRYVEIINYVTGPGDLRLFIRHLENCQPCRAKAENAKRIGEEVDVAVRRSKGTVE